VWKKLSAVKETERFKPEQDEEYEDSAGNVVTKRIFEDLKRQGLL
jgi:splicing factor 3A subunit 3